MTTVLCYIGFALGFLNLLVITGILARLSINHHISRDASFALLSINSGLLVLALVLNADLGDNLFSAIIYIFIIVSEVLSWLFREPAEVNKDDIQRH